MPLSMPPLLSPPPPSPFFDFSFFDQKTQVDWPTLALTGTRDGNVLTHWTAADSTMNHTVAALSVVPNIAAAVNVNDITIIHSPPTEHMSASVPTISSSLVPTVNEHTTSTCADDDPISAPLLSLPLLSLSSSTPVVGGADSGGAASNTRACTIPMSSSTPTAAIIVKTAMLPGRTGPDVWHSPTSVHSSSPSPLSSATAMLSKNAAKRQRRKLLQASSDVTSVSLAEPSNSLGRPLSPRAALRKETIEQKVLATKEERGKCVKDARQTRKAAIKREDCKMNPSLLATRKMIADMAKQRLIQLGECDVLRSSTSLVEGTSAIEQKQQEQESLKIDLHQIPIPSATDAAQVSTITASAMIPLPRTTTTATTTTMTTAATAAERGRMHYDLKLKDGDA
jgi:hypothetical protein